jgi:excisionase family DNA binding protein
MPVPVVRLAGMEQTNEQLLSLPALADALKLPERWIKAEADAGRIPHLKIGKRYRFNREKVLAVLAQRAAETWVANAR